MHTNHPKKTALLWVRHDFRFFDNPALLAAAEYDELIPLYVWDESPDHQWPHGGASKWWLHQSLTKFKDRLAQEGSHLVIRKGATAQEIRAVIQATQACVLLCNQSHDPSEATRVKSVMECLKTLGVEFRVFPGSLLSAPQEMLKKDRTPYLVYTAFWKHFISKYRPAVLAAPEKLPLCPPKAKPLGCKLEDLGLLPLGLTWHEAFHHFWTPGEDIALKASAQFVKRPIAHYQQNRDYPSVQGTSRLSPHLRFGEIHPQRIMAMIAEEHGELGKISDPNLVQYMKELVWRDFSYHLLQHFPATPTEPLRTLYKAFPWRSNPGYFRAWTKGQTGYPIVDAGMRELWKTGWMHNRVRMITASFLVKHLGIGWQEGARWFWDTLVDADLANNTQGWQWTAGCGADAAPYFRIFNPITQGETFDPEGHYIRRWCPELAQLKTPWIFKPWQAPVKDLQKAGVELGVTYPHPIVDHAEARAKALANFASLKG